jgi:hypothetical protein
MNNIYYCKKGYDYYKCVKQKYQKITFTLQKLTKQYQEQIYHHIKGHLYGSNGLDFKFALRYLDECKYYYILRHNESKMYIITKKPLTQYEIDDIFNCMSRIVTISQIFNMHEPYNFFIIMNPLKRTIPVNGYKMNTQNINGGFTYTHKHDIFIIRKEDYKKVIMHELLHHNKILHNDLWKYENIIKLKHHFHIHPLCNLIPNEAVIETFACILHVCFTAIEKNKSFAEVYYDEKTYSTNISKKILTLQNNQLWYETTNAYCYTVIKNILFCNFNKLLRMIDLKYQYNDSIITDFIIKFDKKYTKTKITNKSLKLTYY